MIRIPIWPGVRLTFGGAPNPDAVKVTLAAGKPARVVRLVSKRGWMLLLVSYDWRKPTPAPEEHLMSTPPTPDLPARDFRYELAGAFIDSGCTEFVSRKMADEFLAAHAAAVRTAAFTDAADAAAAWTGDDTPEEDRPGYDGPTIDPEDRLRDALDPEVGPGRREQLITEYRDMVVGEIAGELRRLAAAPTTTTEATDA